MKLSIKKSHFLKLIPISGWIFIVAGLIWPFENIVLLIIWWIDIFLSIVVHPLQLKESLPIGKKLKIPAWKTIINTIIFGATWWKLLEENIDQ